MNKIHNAEFKLNASGLNCPLPVLKARKMLMKMYPGQNLQVVATDPGSVKDFENYCNETGNKLTDSHNRNGKYFYTIKKT